MHFYPTCPFIQHALFSNMAFYAICFSPKCSFTPHALVILHALLSDMPFYPICHLLSNTPFYPIRPFIHYALVSYMAFYLICLLVQYFLSTPTHPSTHTHSHSQAGRPKGDVGDTPWGRSDPAREDTESEPIRTGTASSLDLTQKQISENLQLFEHI